MNNLIFKKINNNVFFLIIVLFLYFILIFINFDLVQKSLFQFIQLTKEIIPVFISIFILMFLLNIYLDKNKIMKLLGHSSGIKGWIISVIGGILSMGPVYIWYPILSDLKEKGMKNSFIAVFLYNRAIKLPVLPIMVHYFGLTFTIILTSYMIIFSIINGILINKIVKL